MNAHYQEMKQLNYIKVLNTVLLLLVISYTIYKSITMGADINIFLDASKRIFKNENIYPKYLYSPMSAILLRPLSIFDPIIGRIIWGIINLILTYRSWVILQNLVFENLILSKKTKKIWVVGVIIISAGFINHNLILGQITIVILWLTLEGLYQILNKRKNILGAMLIAIGIIIKLIPLLALYYLFFKGKIKALVLCFSFIILFVFLPSLIIGHNYNTFLLKNWWETIYPSEGSKYVFENNNGTNSLNALLPAYFYNFNKKESPSNVPRRQILSVSHKTLVKIVQVTRIFFALSFLLLIFHQQNNRKRKSLYFLWEFSYLALITILIFPHQQKYAMLYSVPAGSYLLLFSILFIKSKHKVNLKYKVITILSLSILFISTVSTRDIVGKSISGFFDYYHWHGLANIILMVLLYNIKPELINNFNLRSNTING